jgi:hypothetical protein
MWKTIVGLLAVASPLFAEPPLPEPPPSPPAIISVSPSIIGPQGGEFLTITGTGFRLPVGVFLDSREALVVSITPYRIDVITPPVDLGTGQQKIAKVSVINERGTPNEIRINGGSVKYQPNILKPDIITLSPRSAPLPGGTRITIFGEGFQAPVQVFFGDAEAQVISVNFDQVSVIAPAGHGLGEVPVRVANVLSSTSTEKSDVFRYAPKAVISVAGPTQGPASGGTRLTIDGEGFEDPMAVIVAGVPAQVIRTTPSQIIAVTSPITLSSCADASGPINIVNIDTGDSAAGPAFTYVVAHPVITSVAPAIIAGGTFTVNVANSSDTPRFVLANRVLVPSSRVGDKYTLAVPKDLVTGCQALTTTISFTNLQTTCSDTRTVTVRSWSQECREAQRP